MDQISKDLALMAASQNGDVQTMGMINAAFEANPQPAAFARAARAGEQASASESSQPIPANEMAQLAQVLASLFGAGAPSMEQLSEGAGGPQRRVIVIGTPDGEQIDPETLQRILTQIGIQEAGSASGDDEFADSSSNDGEAPSIIH